MIPLVFLMLAIGGIVAGASVLTINTFGEQMTQCDTAGTSYYDANGNLINSTIQTNNRVCVNDTDTTALLGNTTSEFRTTLEVGDGFNTVSEQFTTIGIIAIMVIVISLISGVFVYFQYFR